MKLGWTKLPFFTSRDADPHREARVRDLCTPPDSDRTYQAFIGAAYEAFRSAATLALAPDLGPEERAYRCGKAAAALQYITAIEGARAAHQAERKP